MSGRLLAGLAVLAAAVLIFFLWPQPDLQPAPATIVEPRPALVVSLPPLDETPPVVAPPELDSGAPPELDAGGLTGIVTIALVREGKPEIGPRLTLRNAQGEEASRPTDVMGLALFELPLGSWLVMAPPELAGLSVEVTPVPSRVTWSLSALRRVEGEVLDEQGAPLVGIALTMQPPRVGGPGPLGGFMLYEDQESRRLDEHEEHAKEITRTDTGGHFSFLTTEESLDLVASRGDTRARKHVVPPATGLKLRLEQFARLSVIPPPRAQVLLSLSSRSETVLHQLSAPTEVRVPVGELEARGLAVIRGKLQRTSHHLIVKADQANVLRLEFVPAPPVSGVVQDATGHALAGVQVGLNLAPANPDTLPRSQELTLTDDQGRFELAPHLVRGGDPVYEVHVMPPWHELHSLLVRLGDAPLTIEAEPSPAGP